MNTTFTKLFSLTLAAITIASVSSTAFAFKGSFEHRHPRRAEVLGRDRHLGQEIREDKGHLGGHYNQLRDQDRRIRRQERWDARHDGGHITPEEQRRLNHEENHLNREINHDDQGR
jgi:hypothetical protein